MGKKLHIEIYKHTHREREYIFNDGDRQCTHGSHSGDSIDIGGHFSNAHLPV